MNEHTARTKTVKKPADRTTKRPSPTQKLLTPQQVTLEYGIPYNTLRNFVHRGELPVFNPTGRRWWIRRVDLEAWIEKSCERMAA